MIRLAISPAATLPSSVGVEQQRAPNGDYFIWLDPAVVNRLAAMRGLGESRRHRPSGERGRWRGVGDSNAMKPFTEIPPNDGCSTRHETRHEGAS
jgi:hypothetical protein